MNRVISNDWVRLGGNPDCSQLVAVNFVVFNGPKALFMNVDSAVTPRVNLILTDKRI